jgi:site-specific recombinase XerC
VAPASGSVRYWALQQLFTWVVEEEEIPRSPMERMRRPVVPEEPIEVLRPEDARTLLAPCAGTDFAGRRDLAILRLVLDTGDAAGDGGLAVHRPVNAQRSPVTGPAPDQRAPAPGRTCRVRD